MRIRSWLAAFALLTPAPVLAQATGACCSPSGQCVVTTQQICESGGREYQGDGVPCEPNPCDAIAGACCFADGTCENLTLVECSALGGVLQVDADCATAKCPTLGACCLVGNLCVVAEPQDCTDGDGEYQGDGVICTPDPCNPTSIPQVLGIPGFAVSPPFPNPSRGAVRFQILLPDRMDVSVEVVDVTGRVVGRHEHAGLDAGSHTLAWWAADDVGRALPGGIYFLRVDTRAGSAMRKIAVAR
jgi:hypothetical protein